MKLEHTPGPWKVLNKIGSDVVLDYESSKERTKGYGCNNDFVCDLDDDEYHAYLNDSERIANARLIAAAPEMLGFLIEGIRRRENTWIEMWGANPDNVLEATDDEIRAACRSHENNATQIALIEKATGKTWEELNA